jgi:hypothetical protein
VSDSFTRRIRKGNVDKLNPSFLPSYQVIYGDLHALQDDIDAIVSELETDVAGTVTAAALDALPQTVERYFRITYADGRELPSPQTLGRIAQMIREAATGVVDWR